jgi:GH35 family endo-1,4-beta-xylanase
MSGFESLSLVRQEKYRPILFGVAISKEQLSNIQNRKYARYIFDSITCFDEMKPKEVRQNIRSISDYLSPASYRFTDANNIVEFARDSLMKVSGSSLWDDPTYNPPLLNTLTTSAAHKSSMSNILSNHITTTIDHFKNNYNNLVYNWEVLNEATSPAPSQANRILGAVYFSDLYRYAEDAVDGTKIKLFYNDDFRRIDTHQTTLLNLKTEDKIHGLGFQCRVSSTEITNDATLNSILLNIENITKKYRSYGFEVHFTEIDFNTATLNHTLKDDFFARLLDIALKYGVSNYTVWGLKDDLSPLNGPGIPAKYPLLLNASYVPNASYNAILNKLKNYKQEATDYDIFIILGQSNSIGWGRTIDPSIGRIGDIMDDDYDNTEDPLIEQWTNYTGGRANEIIVAKERLYHLDPGTNSDYGLAISFARQYIREGKLSANRKILLIGSGWNGTGFLTTTNSDPVKRADSGHWRVMTGAQGATELPRLYDMTLERIRSAISPGNVGTNSLVKGIFWVQGEADAVVATRIPFSSTPAPARHPCPPSTVPFPPASLIVNRNRSDVERNNLLTQYEGFLTTMLNSLRINITKYINNVRTFNLPRQDPLTVPILIGSIPNLQIPCNYRDDYLYMIDRLQSIPPKNTIINSKFVPSNIISGTVFDHFLTTGGPELNFHYNKSSQIEFGKRFFYYYNNLSINVDTDYDIFIIMGQSNSVGRGLLEDPNIPKIGTNMMDDDYAGIENSNIKEWSGSEIIAARERISHLSSPPSVSGTLYGFPTSFARQYVNEKKLSRYRKVLLIGCGFDGAGVLRTHTTNDATGLVSITPNWNSKIRNSLYDQAIRRVRDAINSDGVGRGSEIKGILWHQGETDAKYIKLREYEDISGAPVVDYDDYKTELKLTLDGLRNEFTTIINSKRRSVPAPAPPAPAPALPPAQVATSIPILLGSILPITFFGNGKGDYGYTLMIPIIKSIADNRANINYSFVSASPITGTVFTKTLTGNGMSLTDYVHFNKSSQIEFGKRYFYVYNNNRITTTFSPAPAPT